MLPVKGRSPQTSRGSVFVKTDVEKLEETRAKLTVQVPYEDLKPEIDKAYNQLGKQVSIPGFRKGKVPSPIIDQRIGREAVVQEAVNGSLDAGIRGDNSILLTKSMIDRLIT